MGDTGAAVHVLTLASARKLGVSGSVRPSTLGVKTANGLVVPPLQCDAVIELAIGGLLLRFLYFARVEQLAEAEEARTSQVTPSGLSAMPGWPDARMA